MCRVLLCIGIISLGVTSAVLPDFHRFSNKPEDHVTPRNVTPECLSHTTHWMTALRLGVPWALQMLDSATKLPSGILMGSTSHLGNYDQCIAVNVQEDTTLFKGQYCRALMDMKIPNDPLSTPVMTYAFCVPSTCTAEELPTLINQNIGPALGIEMRIALINPSDCYNENLSEPLPTGALIYIIIVALLACIVVISAVVEWRLADKTPPLVRACSLTSTCRSLFSTRKHPADISCLHGLRVFSMLWIMLGHRYEIDQIMPFTNKNIFLTYFENPMVMTILSAMLAVDTFFFLSGLLVCHTLFRDLRRNPAFDVFKFYVYRYLRLAIPLGIVMVFYLTIIPIIQDCPLKKGFVKESDNCKIYWWTNVLFINNYIGQETALCMGQLWYTAVDMQLAWLSPLVLLPLYHSPRAGLQLMTLLILISCFIPFTIVYLNKFPWILKQAIGPFSHNANSKQTMGNKVYFPTHARATTYLCGILFAYFKLHTNFNIKLNKMVVYLAWTCSTIVALAVIYTPSIFSQADYVYSELDAAFYDGFHRLGWSAVIAWIIFACVNNYAGAVEKILSWQLLLPLSRLTYSTFLVHFAVLMYKSAISKTVANFTDYYTVHNYFGHLLPVYFISFLLYVLVESPLLSLLRIIFSKVTKPQKKEKDVIGQDK